VRNTTQAASVPNKVAVGSNFALRYVATSGRYTQIRFEPEGILSGEPAYLRAKASGKVQVVAIDYDSDEEIDRATIEVTEPKKIEILDLRTRTTPKTELELGDDLQVFPQAMAEGTLAGALAPDFTVDPPDALVRDENKAGWYYRAKRAGRVVLTARQGSATGTLRLDVQKD
jgi:hypothetical protein